MVCDLLDVAVARALESTLCYERGTRVKAITLDGTIIHKSRLLAGGVTGAGLGRRWEELEIHALKSIWPLP